MTSALPLPLSCLALSHIIDEPDVVEGFLSQDPTAADCLPLILRDVIFVGVYQEVEYPIPSPHSSIYRQSGGKRMMSQSMENLLLVKA